MYFQCLVSRTRISGALNYLYLNYLYLNYLLYVGIEKLAGYFLKTRTVLSHSHHSSNMAMSSAKTHLK